MPIRPPRAARSGLPLVQAAIAELARVPGFVAEVFDARKIGQGAVTASHAIHNLDVDTLARGEDLQRARPTGLGYVVLEDGQPRAMAEVALDGEGQPTSFSNLTQGREFDSLVSALRLLDRQADADEGDFRGDFELRVLRIPALYVRAIWLKNLGSDPDVLVPVAGPGLRLGVPTSAERFLSALRERASEVAAFPDDVES